MELSKALKQYVDEMDGYHEYMECYDEYKVSHPEHAKMYHVMAQDELKHCNMLLGMYPDLNELINKLKMHNPH